MTGSLQEVSLEERFVGCYVLTPTTVGTPISLLYLPVGTDSGAATVHGYGLHP